MGKRQCYKHILKYITLLLVLYSYYFLDLEHLELKTLYTYNFNEKNI